MDNNNISERLKALAKGKNRSVTSRIREIFNEIETALKSGARRKDVHQALTESGFEITFESFELVIYRIRQERKKTGVPDPPPDQSSTYKSSTRTGFHQVIEKIAEQNSNEDPRRDN